MGVPQGEARKFVFDYFFENSQAPVLEEMMAKFSVSRTQASRTLEELEAAHHVIRVPGTNRILMANPFSALDTPFRVAVGGKEYFGACAWDAVAFHIMLNQSTQVKSFCHHCADPISIGFNGGRVESSTPSNPLVYLALPAARWWENIVITCANNMVFFSSSGHLGEWLKENPGPQGEALTLDQALKISIPIYRDKMRLDYSRPTKEELMTYWHEIGLRGDFWRL